jgi:RNA-directed DNA polymerase
VQDALDEVGRAICREPTSCVLELDITSYFDSIVREQLMEMIGRRISDASILRLIRKWINIGVIDDGRLLVSETGTGQWQIITPLTQKITCPDGGRGAAEGRSRSTGASYFVCDKN